MGTHSNFVPDSLNPEQAAIVAEIGELHRKRGEAWLRREAEAYLSFYWDDAVIFTVDECLTPAELRHGLVSLLNGGGGPLAMNLPLASKIAEVTADHCLIAQAPQAIERS